jgi:hypothetical protein
LQKKIGIKVEKGQVKQVNLDGTKIEKKILPMHHPTTLVHWSMLVHFDPVTFTGL